MRRLRAGFVTPHSGGSGHQPGDTRVALSGADCIGPAQMPGSRSLARDCKMPLWSAERRGPYVTGPDMPRKRVPGRVMAWLGRKPRCAFRRFAPSHGVREKGMKAHPAPFKQYGRRSVGFAGCLKFESPYPPLSCPGLTRASMRWCSKPRSYELRLRRALMDRRVKPGDDSGEWDASAASLGNAEATAARPTPRRRQVRRSRPSSSSARA
jgi:hypothetical protein